jgi:hypothetical protein
VRVAGSDDLDALTAVITTAFSNDPAWGPYSFPQTHTRQERPARFWRAYLQMTLRFPWTLVSGGCGAAAVWIPPGEPESTNPANDERSMRRGLTPRGRIELAGGHIVTTMWRPARA